MQAFLLAKADEDSIRTKLIEQICSSRKRRTQWCHRCSPVVGDSVLSEGHERLFISACGTYGYLLLNSSPGINETQLWTCA